VSRIGEQASGYINTIHTEFCTAPLFCTPRTPVDVSRFYYKQFKLINGVRYSHLKMMCICKDLIILDSWINKVPVF